MQQRNGRKMKAAPFPVAYWGQHGSAHISSGDIRRVKAYYTMIVTNTVTVHAKLQENEAYNPLDRWVEICPREVILPLLTTIITIFILFRIFHWWTNHAILNKVIKGIIRLFLSCRPQSQGFFFFYVGSRVHFFLF